MAALQPVRGTQDLLPETARRHRRVIDVARALAELYGYAEMATPIFEFTEVFARPIGEATDIVQKEMYTFKDRGGDEITLRPENTAGVVRAVLSNGLVQQAPLKFFYSGPMFRYERPQKGRFRQFHQIGVELLGVPQPNADVEIIALGQRILTELGLNNRVVLKLNTLGDVASRAAYRDALVGYFSARKSELSDESLRRLERNPLRILDSKDPRDRRICAEAPDFRKFLGDEPRRFFESVQNGLGLLGISHQVDPTLRLEVQPGLNYAIGAKPEGEMQINVKYEHGLNGYLELDPHLVRGLDYYTHTVFEFVTTDLGAQGTVLAGGRYDGLVQLMGGPSMPGVGWAAGMERLALLASEPRPPVRPIAIIPVGEAGQRMALVIAEVLRYHFWCDEPQRSPPVDLEYSGNLARGLRRANRMRARVAVLVGEDELARNHVALRDLDTGVQNEIQMDLSLNEVRERIAAMYGFNRHPCESGGPGHATGPEAPGFPRARE